MGDVHRVQVLLQPGEAERFERFCRQRGHKKSTLIARLIRDHLDQEESGDRTLPSPRRAAI